MIKEGSQIVYYNILLIQSGRGEMINPVFIPGEGQHMQGQTTKIRAMATEENAQGIQMQLKKRHITGTNMEDLEVNTLICTARVLNSTTAQQLYK